ncbi:MAG: metalloregulator ArsR/SmtB family transcription factor [Magnetococcales bacterium]|nr:metalloregulator ArsR/SmtB family transcription factor [Magnetococcales bacterium]
MDSLETHTQRLKALSDPLRLRMALLLRQAGELCVCDLVTILERQQSTVSRQLANLKSVGWVASRRDGVWMHYRLVLEKEAPEGRLLEAVAELTSKSRIIQQDRFKLEQLEPACNVTLRCGGSSDT